MLTVYFIGVMSGMAGLFILQHGWGYVLAKINGIRGKL